MIFFKTDNPPYPGGSVMDYPRDFIHNTPGNKLIPSQIPILLGYQ